MVDVDTREQIDHEVRNEKLDRTLGQMVLETPPFFCIQMTERLNQDLCPPLSGHFGGWSAAMVRVIYRQR